MHRLLKEPLFHFLLIGAALFVWYELANRDDRAPESDREVIVSEGRINQLARIFAKTWQRPPSEEELEGLINDFVLEEIYYREAVAMGIDKDDTMIRRRMRQKLEFLTDDAAALVEPTEEELQAYLDGNAEKFRLEPRYTFRQLYFNPERHGENPIAAVRGVAEKLRAGEEADGDRSLMPGEFELASKRVVDNTFGSGFSSKLDGLKPGVWSDPIQSGLGLHLIFLDTFVPGEIPSLEKVRATVMREWANERRIEVRKQFNDTLLDRYEVIVERPKAETQAESGGADLSS